MITSMVRLPPEARDQGLALVHTGRAAAVTLCQARRWRNAEGGPSVATGLRRRLRTPGTRVPPRSTACARPWSNRVWRGLCLASARPVGRLVNGRGPRRPRASREPVMLRPPAADSGPGRDGPPRWGPGTLSTPSAPCVSAPRATPGAPTGAAAMGDAPAGQRGPATAGGGMEETSPPLVADPRPPLPATRGPPARVDEASERQATAHLGRVCAPWAGPRRGKVPAQWTAVDFAPLIPALVC